MKNQVQSAESRMVQVFHVLSCHPPGPDAVGVAQESKPVDPPIPPPPSEAVLREVVALQPREELPGADDIRDYCLWKVSLHIFPFHYFTATVRWHLPRKDRSPCVVERFIISIEATVPRINSLHAQSRDCPEAFLTLAAIQRIYVTYLQFCQAVPVCCTHVPYLLLPRHFYRIVRHRNTGPRHIIVYRRM